VFTGRVGNPCYTKRYASIDDYNDVIGNNGPSTQMLWPHYPRLDGPISPVVRTDPSRVRNDHHHSLHLMAGTHYPCSRAVFTGREHGCHF